MLHRWDITPKDAVSLQKKLQNRVRTDLGTPVVRSIAGVDVAYLREEHQSIATVVLLSFPQLQPLEQAIARVETPFPYVPGLLSFREVPPLLEAFEKLTRKPDLIFVDGHGRAHPRRLGIASHLGLWLEKPTIGIGKSRLCGDYQTPGDRKGDRSDLLDGTEIIGVVLRTRDRVRPIFVSIGYGLELDTCVEWTLRVTTRYRLPEPIRQADRVAALNK
jgi:deoxyribonuclease V